MMTTVAYFLAATGAVSVSLTTGILILMVAATRWYAPLFDSDTNNGCLLRR
jgi:hypothetical protein